MFSFKPAVLVAAFLAIGAQSQREYNINPDDVLLSIRTSWCSSQQNSCPLLCLQLPGASSTTIANDCDAKTLTYDCICGNGLSPNASEYSQTIPYFKCVLFGEQCVAGCGGSGECAKACRTNNPCGAQSPTRINTTTSSSMVATATRAGAGVSTNSAGAVFTGLAGSPAETEAASSNSKNSGAQAALALGSSYGLVVVLSGLFAGFALIM